MSTKCDQDPKIRLTKANASGLQSIHKACVLPVSFNSLANLALEAGLPIVRESMDRVTKAFSRRPKPKVRKQPK